MRPLLIISISFLLQGCIILTDVSHSFEQYGTDALRTNSEFFYVKQSAIGKSSISYNFNRYGQYLGGGDVKKGCLADAKSALAMSSPLGANQAYTNMSIDVTKTVTKKHYKGLIGSIFGSISPYYKIQKITYNTVVSADIIEYGVSPENMIFPSPGSEAWEQLTENKLGQLELHEGQSIKYKDIDGGIYQAVVLGYNPSDKSYKIMIEISKGAAKKSNVLPGSYSRIIQ